MPSKICLSRASLEVVSAHFSTSLDDLYDFRHPSIKGAATAIAKAKGFSDYEQMVSQRLAVLGTFDPARFASLSPDDKAVYYSLVIQEPSNYKKVPEDFLGIDVAMKILFGNNPSLKGLQLACNWGPYLLYLREKRGFTEFMGLDPDSAAVDYAASLGLRVLPADAAQIALASKSLDVVVSHSFLEPNYLGIIEDARAFHRSILQSTPIPSPATSGILSNFRYPENTSMPFRRLVANEIFRVLRPGGWYISCTEIDRDSLKTKPEALILEPFGNPDHFSEEVLRGAESLKTVCAFQRPLNKKRS